MKKCPHCSSWNTKQVPEAIQPNPRSFEYHWHCNDCGKDFEASTH